VLTTPAKPLVEIRFHAVQRPAPAPARDVVVDGKLAMTTLVVSQRHVGWIPSRYSIHPSLSKILRVTALTSDHGILLVAWPPAGRQRSERVLVLELIDRVDLPFM